MIGIKVWGVEFSYKVKDFMDSWNVSVHTWLKYYVYLRLMRKDRKGVQLMPIMMTFAISAIWHGFYPGYYLFFLSSGVMDYIFKLGEKIYILFDDKWWAPVFLQRFLLL